MLLLTITLCRHLAGLQIGTQDRLFKICRQLIGRPLRIRLQRDIPQNMKKALARRSQAGRDQYALSSTHVRARVLRTADAVLNSSRSDYNDSSNILPTTGTGRCQRRRKRGSGVQRSRNASSAGSRTWRRFTAMHVPRHRSHSCNRRSDP